MVKNLYSCALICTVSLALLVGCSPQAPDSAADTTISTRAGTGPEAKPLFEAVQFAAPGPATTYGRHARGCFAGGEALEETGPTWQAMRLSRNRYWSRPITLDYVKDLSRQVAKLPGWEGLYVGDLSLPMGGPVSGHASHQSGLDVDIWMLPPDRLNLTRTERENLSSISTRRERGAFVGANWTEEHRQVLKLAASDPRVDRIFVFGGAKVEMCNRETGDRAYLRKIRPWYGHHYHFHVRLSCPDGDPNCVNQAPVPPGDGCDHAQAWVDRILNPPPPDPNAPPRQPRPPIRLGDLPQQCSALLASQ
ncbi:MAG: penicillin-insensitive murein endopeptidase [Pseudomonadota bacterium]